MTRLDMPGIAKNAYDWVVNNIAGSTATYIGLAVLVVTIIVMGVLFMTGEENRKKAMKALPWILVGLFAVLSAVTIANNVQSSMAF